MAVAAGRERASVHEFNHIVVIYQENHSFDNLYGLWGKVDGRAVDGLPNADQRTRRRVRAGQRTRPTAACCRTT